MLLQTMCCSSAIVKIDIVFNPRAFIFLKKRFQFTGYPKLVRSDFGLHSQGQRTGFIL